MEAGKLALAKYQEARGEWASMADRANNVYHPDITYGNIPMRRGSWVVRLPGIDRDLAAMRSQARDVCGGSRAVGPTVNIERSIQAATGRPNRPSVNCVHTPPTSFHPGQPLSLSLRSVSASNVPNAVHLYYRHVNQAERWRSVEMQPSHDGYAGTIPEDYTNSVYPLQYYFVLQRGTEAAWFFPAFNSSLSNQPYFAIAKRS